MKLYPLHNKMNTIITFLIGTKQYIEANLFASLLAALYSFMGRYVYNDPLAIQIWLWLTFLISLLPYISVK